MSPDSDSTGGTIDVIAVNPRTGFVELAVLDDGEWPDSDAHARWLIAKLNLCIGYAFGGQMEREAKYSGRPVKFAVHFRLRPSREVRQAIKRMRDHLAKRDVLFAVTNTGIIKDEVDIDAWADAAE